MTSAAFLLKEGGGSQRERCFLGFRVLDDTLNTVKKIWLFNFPFVAKESTMTTLS